MRYLSLPLVFLRFWYLEAPRLIILKYFSINGQFFHLFSLPILLRSYFKPWKNEYRKGFVGVAIGLGIFIKTFFIIADVILFILLLLIEAIFLVFFVLWPVFTLILLIK